MTRLPSAPPKTASLYGRLSKAAGAENVSGSGMLADLRALAAREGLIVVAEHIDDGKSGAIRDRPEFVRWLDDARELRASNLIAWHVDRMTREGVNVAGLILDAVEGKDPTTGALVRAPVRLMDTRGLDSAGDETAFRFSFVIKAEVARAERQRMRDRSREAHARLSASGRWTGGTPPFGFESVPGPEGGRVLAVEPTEGAALREAAEQLIAGSKLVDVVRWFNAHAPAPRRARAWTKVTLAQSLTTDAARAHLFGPAERRALSGMLAPRGGAWGARNPGRAPTRLLSRMVFCANCERPMRVGARLGTPIYRCTARAEGAACPTSASVSAELLEAHVSGLFLDAFGHLPMVTMRAVVLGADDIAEAEERKAAVLAQLAVAPTADAFVALQEAQARLEALSALPTETVIRSVPTGRTVSQEWAAESVAGCRAMLADYIEAIVVRPGRAGPRGLDPARVSVVPRPDWGGFDD